MGSFTKGPDLRTPFGRRHFLGSTQDVKVESYTLAAAAWPSETVDGVAQKIAQPGTFLAVITSGDDEGKVGPFREGGAANEIQEIAVDATGGTWTPTVLGTATAAIDFDATPAEVKAAIVTAVAAIGNDDIIVTGGPGDAGGTTPYRIEFTGDFAGKPVAAITVADALTGGAGTATVTEVTAGGAGGGGDTTGLSDASNIVGVLNTFLPWQLMERDVEVGVVYEATIVGELCRVRNAAGTAWAAPSQATLDAAAVTRRTRFTYRKRSSEI
jgi:hypothetical protein